MAIWNLQSRRKGGERVEGRSIRSKEKKKSNVVIIVSGEDAEEIKEELLHIVRKMRRKKELGYYITPVELASLETVQKFADFSLKISTVNGRRLNLI